MIAIPQIGSCKGEYSLAKHPKLTSVPKREHQCSLLGTQGEVVWPTLVWPFGNSSIPLWVHLCSSLGTLVLPKGVTNVVKKEHL